MREYVDDKAQIGTLAHQMVQGYLEGNQTDFTGYSQEQISQAENALLSFYEWEKVQNIEIIEMETHLVSDEMLVGGTIDCLLHTEWQEDTSGFQNRQSCVPGLFHAGISI